ncbi:M15 family metallopeptidase [Thalassotalea piscium]
MSFSIKNKKTLCSLSILIFAFTHSAQASEIVSKQQFVDIKLAIPSVVYDIRYASKNNFVGEVIDGYLAPKCLIRQEVIKPLIKLSDELLQQGYRLKLYDCYRPEKAVKHFMRWALDLSDTKTKNTYYPNLDKSNLVGQYIAEKSGHSKGFTLDLTIQMKDKNGTWHDLDMGSTFDMFDKISNTETPLISPQQKYNRQILKVTLERNGFTNYPMEWWHFTYTKTPKSQRQHAYNFDVL